MKLELTSGILIGVWAILVILVLPRLPFVIRRIRGQIHVWRHFKQKRGIMQGFGIVVNGSPVTQRSREPLLFESPQEAKEYIGKREFERKNPFTGKPNKVLINHQVWNLEEFEVTFSEVKVV